MVNGGEVTSVRRPGGCGPCGDATPGWRGRRGCASADGNRASCDDDGCSAGTYACSRVCSPGVGGVTRPVLGPGLGDSDRVGPRLSAGTAHPRRTTASRSDERVLVVVRGHAAPVDTGSTAQRYAVRRTRVKPGRLRPWSHRNRPPLHVGCRWPRCHAGTILANRPHRRRHCLGSPVDNRLIHRCGAC